MSDDQQTVNIGALREVAEAIFGHLEELGYADVTIDKDYYWEVLPDESFNMSTKPDKLAVGSISDDLSQLKQLQAGRSQPLVTDLLQLAAVLRLLAMTTNERGPSDSPR